MPSLSQLFNKPGVWPGFLGGMAVPLAILATQSLPPPLGYQELHATAAQFACLFVTMPPLGALCSYGVANKRIRGQFMTGVTAPALIISAIILFNLAKKLQETKFAKRELAQASAEQKESIDEISKKLKPSEKRAIPELLNGTEPQ